MAGKKLPQWTDIKHRIPIVAHCSYCPWSQEAETADELRALIHAHHCPEGKGPAKAVV